MSVNDRKQEQLMLSFLSEEEPSQSGIVTPKTTQGTEDLVFGGHTMEEICEEENMKKAMMQTAFPIHFFDTVGLPRLNKKPNT